MTQSGKKGTRETADVGQRSRHLAWFDGQIAAPVR
jgi:hypothetical protein